MRGSTMCSSCPPQWRRMTSRTSAGVSLPLGASMAQTLWPEASIAPVSWTLMWPVSAAITPSHGRSAAAMTVVLAMVPPTRKCTSAAGQAKRARMAARASSQNGSML